jgi:hypothetical protein
MSIFNNFYFVLAVAAIIHQSGCKPSDDVSQVQSGYGGSIKDYDCDQLEKESVTTRRDIWDPNSPSWIRF